ncbi:MAG: hypothetical protein ACOYOJ_21365 [Alsobacter sp.]
MPKLLLASLCLALAGCETLTPGVTSQGAADAFKPIAASPRDTCETQKQVAEHNSRLDTIKSGKEVVYTAACEPPARTASLKRATP